MLFRCFFAQVALSRRSLRALYTTLDESMPYVLMTGPPDLLDVLSRYFLNDLFVSYYTCIHYLNNDSAEDISPTNIWVSLQTKEQFISCATQMLQKKVHHYRYSILKKVR